MLRSGDFAAMRPTCFLILNQSSTHHKVCKDVESWSVLWFMYIGHGSDFNISHDPDKGVKCLGLIKPLCV